MIDDYESLWLTWQSNRARVEVVNLGHTDIQAAADDATERSMELFNAGKEGHATRVSVCGKRPDSMTLDPLLYAAFRGEVQSVMPVKAWVKVRQSAEVGAHLLRALAGVERAAVLTRQASDNSLRCADYTGAPEELSNIESLLGRARGALRRAVKACGIDPNLTAGTKRRQSKP